jgi:hypothetical protein
MNTKRTQNPLNVIVTMLLILAVGALFAFFDRANAAPAQQDSFNVLAATPALSHDAVSAVDTSTAGSEPLDGRITHGNPKVTADVSMTDDGGTVTLAIYLWRDKGDGTWDFLGQQQTALTCDDHNEDDGYRPATPPEWSTRGATHYEVRVIAYSNPGVAGLTVRPWSFGARSQ